MKKRIVFAGSILLILIGSYLGLSFYAVKLINARLKTVIGSGVAVTDVAIRPTHLSARGIRYDLPATGKCLFQVEEIRIYPALLSALKGEFRIRNVTMVRPSFYISRSREGIWLGPWPPGKQKPDAHAGERQEAGGSSLKIDRIQIEDGVIDFEDRKVEGPPAQIRMRKLQCDVKDAEYPFVKVRCPIALKGTLMGPIKGGDFETKGWIDFSSLDMETVLKVRGVEVKTFEPYYRKRVSAEIESGDLHLEAKINVARRMIQAPGDLELADLKVKEGGGSVLWIPASTLVSLLKNKGNRIKVRFEVKGNLDDPQFNLQEDLMRRVALGVAEALGIPIKVVGEELFKGVFKGTEGLAEGLRSLEELFRPPRKVRK